MLVIMIIQLRRDRSQPSSQLAVRVRADCGAAALGHFSVPAICSPDTEKQGFVRIIFLPPSTRTLLKPLRPLCQVHTHACSISV